MRTAVNGKQPCNFRLWHGKPPPKVALVPCGRLHGCEMTMRILLYCILCIVGISLRFHKLISKLMTLRANAIHQTVNKDSY